MKTFLIVFLFASSVFAQDFSTRYDVNVGMFGKVGYADITLKENGDSYEAKLVATTVDVAATLLGNRVEIFISKGKIIDGKYVPESFVKIKETTKKSREQTYYFNHEKKEIILVEEKTKLVSRTRFDPSTFKITSKETKERSINESVLESYSSDDVLSSYLNTKTSCNEDHKLYDLVAVGAYNEKNNVTLSCLEGSQKESATANFSNDINNIYNLHVAPLDKDESIVDVLVAFDNDGLLKEALLGEIFWVGAITAKRVYHEVSRN